MLGTSGKGNINYVSFALILYMKLVDEMQVHYVVCFILMLVL